MSPGVLYNGWCVEQGLPLTTTPGHTDSLYSTSPATNLPDTAQFYRDPLTPIVQSTPALLNTPIPWGSLNYLLNHKLGTAKDVQTAIWLLIWGAIPPTFTVTQNVTDMLNAAIANPGFVPATGDTIAVLLYNDGIGHITEPPQSQEIIIEVTPVYDLGDLPQPTPPTPPTYPTLLTSGPSHQLQPGQTLFLGACVDAELDGQPNGTATLDDGTAGSPVFGVQSCTDDEDGVTRVAGIGGAGNGGGWTNGTVASNDGGAVQVTITAGRRAWARFSTSHIMERCHWQRY